MGTETVCTPVHLESWTWAHSRVEGRLVLPGPWRGLLRSKRAGRYQPVRFTVHGELTVHTTPNIPPPLCPDRGIEVTVKYLGRGGEEIMVLYVPGTSSGVKHRFERSIDISKWRGPGLQGVYLRGLIAFLPVPPWCSYTNAIDGKVCFTLSWVD